MKLSTAWGALHRATYFANLGRTPGIASTIDLYSLAPRISE